MTADAKLDAEELMNEVLPFAEKMLIQRGEFFPFGGAMKPNGEIVSIAGYDGREKPPSQDIIDLLVKEFRKDVQAGLYKATAIVYDVRVSRSGKTDKSDAIAIALNHRDQYSRVVLFPYSLEDGNIILDDPISQKNNIEIFDVGKQ